MRRIKFEDEHDRSSGLSVKVHWKTLWVSLDAVLDSFHVYAHAHAHALSLSLSPPHSRTSIYMQPKYALYDAPVNPANLVVS